MTTITIYKSDQGSYKGFTCKGHAGFADSGNDIVCENDNLYYIDYNGRKQRIGAVYRRISDEYLDPMTLSMAMLNRNKIS